MQAEKQEASHCSQGVQEVKERANEIQSTILYRTITIFCAIINSDSQPISVRKGKEREKKKSPSSLQIATVSIPGAMLK
jgi:hypothetical protein